MKQNHCIIIGAGMGGLAVAIRMAAKGYQVTVLEKNDFPGGKSGQIGRNRFRFDTGPSLLTLPHLVEDLLKKGGLTESPEFRYRKLASVCRYFFEDGTRFNAYDDPRKFAEELFIQTGEPQKNVTNYLKDAEKLYEASADLFIFNPVRRLFRAATQHSPGRLIPLLKVNPLRTMHSENKRRFRSPQVVQLFDRYATYNGSSPYLAPSVLNVIAHLEHNTGAFFPEKGMYNIVEILWHKALSLGVQFRFGSEVTGLEFDKKVVTAVNTNHKKLSCDFVVSGVDVNTFYRKTAPRLKPPRSVRHPHLSSSALIFYWGMDRSFPETDVHNILFSAHYKEEFNSLFKKKELFHDPTVYLFISSKVVTEDAPAGCENWFVMINVPPMDNEVPERLRQQAKQYIIGKIRRVLGIDPLPHILFEEVATPRTIQEQTGSFKGAIYGNNSNSLWSAFLRHGNRSRNYTNLFFTGGSVHPGGGIPLCLASAAIVEREIQRSYNAH
ncbi:MAG: 1-hydroxycarotenoid 3,4-desaturase CrtD [Marinilabilia sp.]